eukprot:CAMPEP_0117791412 /NCGR_PEP_ID=MMETSP0948-20121206/8844_1 /TAXON_ID=44440 /ORGANISM="Chattonella subsalsa, Strain CCMP2191" /LENGTH=693 /DNA_ID=CAMNT_0005621465 /DNA_START=54 /DNA_END=2132 /DNA_ORIENTATION=+
MNSTLTLGSKLKRRRKYVWIQISIYICCSLVIYVAYHPTSLSFSETLDQNHRQLGFFEPGTCNDSDFAVAEVECQSLWNDTKDCDSTTEYFDCLQDRAFSCYDSYVARCESDITQACGKIPSCSCQTPQLYPVDAFFEQPYCINLEKPRSLRSAVLLHIIGMGYMFIGLSLVCDEYFCAALDVMVERWKIKPDVAGATLMAAGGSAPELFTSLLGVFFSESDVGFGTVVGSAVFNVLFVIGLCGFCSVSILKLTWWPLFRDCSYYLVSLTVLAVFASDQVIHWYEAVVLFAMYLNYVVMMRWNSQLEAFFTQLFLHNSKKVHAENQQKSSGQQAQKKVPEKNPSAEVKDQEQGLPAPGNSLYSKTSTGQQANKKLPDGTKGKQYQPTRSSIQNPERLKRVVKREVTKHWKVTGEINMAKAQKAIDAKKANIAILESAVSMRILLNRMAEGKQSNIISPAFSMEGMDGSIGSAESAASVHPFEDSLRSSLEISKRVIMEEQKKEGEKPEDYDSDEDNDDSMFDWPETTKERILFLVVFPISVLLHFAIPNCSKKKYEDYFVVTFALSLFWIFIFSFLMVWWATIFGAVTIPIPEVVMGLTLLAMGTSIPDAVSSVVMARIGEGDMAVSSSIGSNIFDILFGLPVPWILYGLIVSPIKSGKIASYSISSDYIAAYVLVLMMMVFLVIASIIIRKW